MKIELRKDWDLPISKPRFGEKQDGYFVGRKLLISKLANEIHRRKNGSILISGQLGVGKTSFIYKVIGKLVNNKYKQQEHKNIGARNFLGFFKREELNQKILLPIFINGGQFISALKGAEEEKQKGILRIIITRLYKSFEEYSTSPVPESLMNLYVMANASQFSSNVLKAEKKNQSTSIEIGMNLEKVLINFLKIALFGISWFVISNIISISINKLEFLLNYEVIVKNLLGIIGSFFISSKLLYKENYSSKESISKQYLLDNSSWNVVNDLEEVHKEMSENFKILYIFDELDKLNNGNINSVIRHLKNFFTLTNAIFIFITKNDYYEEILGDKINREQIYTYFSARYFVKRPRWIELREYFLQIMKRKSQVEEVGEEIKENPIEMYKRFLCLKAKNDFFELKLQINERINEIDKDGFPVINLFDDFMEIERLGKFHKLVQVMFDTRYSKGNYEIHKYLGIENWFVNQSKGSK